jgi:hypothetical protein
MPRWPGPRKYVPLGDYLAQRVTDTVRLTLAEIEAILGSPLPPTATWTPFWSNYVGNPPAVRGWLRVGWRVQRQPGSRWVEAVTFVRVAADSTASPRLYRANRPLIVPRTAAGVILP